MRHNLCLTFIIAFTALAILAIADVPKLITYQGWLTDNSGTPVADGNYSFQFQIYDAASAGNVKWNSGTRTVSVSDGLFTHILGDSVPLPHALFANDTALWLGVKVGANPEFTPRTRLTSFGYAHQALRADTALYALNTIGGSYLPLSGGTMTGPITNTGNPSISMGKGNFGLNNSNSGTSAFVAGESNAASGNLSTIGGGGNNFARGVYSTVSGGGGSTTIDSNSAIGGWSTIGGGQRNAATVAHSTVGGGLANVASGFGSVVGGGEADTAGGLQSVVGGGNSNTARGDFSTVAGGRANHASGHYSVALGQSDSAREIWSTVSGGHFNTATDTAATIGGGKYNKARGEYSTISGGGGPSLLDSNSAYEGWSTIGGGSGNKAAYYSTISGGAENIASGIVSTVGGGQWDTASGSWSTVSGGYSNTASGRFSFVGGGSDNLAADSGSTVAGGRFNSARGIYATIGGGGGPVEGDTNSASGNWSTIFGGQRNTASGNHTVVGGGQFNRAISEFATIAGGASIYASGQFSTVGGGVANAALGLGATVGGGSEDTAIGIYSTVPGGRGNRAQGSYSFAAGRRARADHSGTFVWGDATDAIFVSTGVDQFLIRAGGGVGVGTNAPLGRLHVANSVWSSAPVRISGISGSSVGPTLTIDGTNGTAGNSYSIISTNSGAGAGGGKFAIYDDAPGTSGYRLVIDSLGAVGIGTLGPQAKLHVGGGSGSQILLDNQGDLMWKDFGGTPKAVLTLESDNNVYFDASSQPGSAIVLRTSDPPTERVRIDASQFTIAAVGIDVTRNGGTVAFLNRGINDGTVVAIQQAGATEGTISVSGTTVSYNAFTGSHYGWTNENLKEGELVSFTGINNRSHNNPEAEIIYGISKSSTANDPACLGSYLALSEPNQPYSVENPHLVMAVGNGEMWVTDEGGDIRPGDYLISSSTPGHAMKDDEEKYAIGHIVARAAESADWSSVSESFDGRKHKKISVLFGNFVRSNANSLAQTVKEQNVEIQDLKARLSILEAGLLQLRSEK